MVCTSGSGVKRSYPIGLVASPTSFWWSWIMKSSQSDWASVWLVCHQKGLGVREEGKDWRRREGWNKWSIVQRRHRYFKSGQATVNKIRHLCCYKRFPVPSMHRYSLCTHMHSHTLPTPKPITYPSSNIQNQIRRIIVHHHLGIVSISVPHVRDTLQQRGWSGLPAAEQFWHYHSCTHTSDMGHILWEERKYNCVFLPYMTPLQLKSMQPWGH